MQFIHLILTKSHAPALANHSKPYSMFAKILLKSFLSTIIDSIKKISFVPIKFLNSLII